jgi:hypothetical protein
MAQNDSDVRPQQQEQQGLQQLPPQQQQLNGDQEQQRLRQEQQALLASMPEVLEWARHQFSEEEIVAGLLEIRKTGGRELSQFIQELEKQAGPHA